LDGQFALLADEEQVAAGNEGARRSVSQAPGKRLEIRHVQLASADVDCSKQRDTGGHAASSRRDACALASSVIDAPDNIRAISSRRSSALSLRTLVRVPSGPWLFSIR